MGLLCWLHQVIRDPISCLRAPTSSASSFRLQGHLPVLDGRWSFRHVLIPGSCTKRGGRVSPPPPFMEPSLKSHTVLPLTSPWLELSSWPHLTPRRLGSKQAVVLLLRLRGDLVLGKASSLCAPTSALLTHSSKGQALPLLIIVLQTWV